MVKKVIKATYVGNSTHYREAGVYRNHLRPKNEPVSRTLTIRLRTKAEARTEEDRN